MILYELTCPNDHGFEGWFSSSADFDRQSEAKQINCPVCDDPRVRRAMMAPRINKQGIAKHARGPAERGQAAPALPSNDPSAANQMVSDFCNEITASHDYVGKEFPEEARKIHYGETPKRPIYGEATISQAVELKDEGIAVVPLPLIKKSDA